MPENMTTMENVAARLRTVIERGEKLYDARRRDSESRLFIVDEAALTGWKLSATNVLRRVVDIGSHYDEGLIDAGKPSGFQTNADELKKMLAVLREFEDDLKEDQLANVEALVSAQVFGDFLEQAEYLLAENYFVAAAVIAGAVLEEHLRKLCANFDIIPPARATLNWLNDALKKAEAYNEIRRKEIALLAAIRNDAAHGTPIKDDDARRLVRDIPAVLLALPL